MVMEAKLIEILENIKTAGQLQQSHLQILIHGLQNSPLLLPKLITLSSTLHSLHRAHLIFRTTSPAPNALAHNTMIQCLSRSPHHTPQALATYRSMSLSSLPPNAFTFTFLLHSCKLSQRFLIGTAIHAHVLKFGFGSSVFVQNALLELHAKCPGGFAPRVFDEMSDRDVVSWNTMIGVFIRSGEKDTVLRLFEQMPERNLVSWNSIVTWLAKAGDMDAALAFFRKMPMRNAVSWNAMIAGYVRKGDMEKAKLVFDSMSGNKNVVSWTAMISGYAKVGEVDSARELFKLMPLKNAVTWNAMIAGYIQNNLFANALSLFQEMLITSKCKPNEATLVSVLSACAHLGALEQGKWIDSYIKKNGYYLGNLLGNALIHMFAKCGVIEEAIQVFHFMAERCVITWTTMITGLAINGECREALDLFNRIFEKGIVPDDVIFISVLSACTHGGLVKEGKHIFSQMVKEYGIEPRIEHYGCMVDLLSRAGLVEEAFTFVRSMPMKPNSVIWDTLLSACKIHGKQELADAVTLKLRSLESSNPGHAMTISNLNASIGQWEDVLSVRSEMKKQGIEKVPGCSSIQIRNTVHEFLAKDTTHERGEEIYIMLDTLKDHLKAFEALGVNLRVENST